MFQVKVTKSDGSVEFSSLKFDTFDMAVSHGNDIAESALVLCFSVQEVEDDAKGNDKDPNANNKVAV